MTKSKWMTLAVAALMIASCGKNEDTGQDDENNTPVVILDEEDMASSEEDMAEAPAEDMGGEETEDMGSIEQDMASGEEDMGSEEPGFVFEGEQVACAVNPAFEEAKAVLQGGKINPTGRGEQAAIYDPCHERVILFGGNDNQPAQCQSFGAKNYIGDTWSYSLEFDNWYRIQLEDAPPARGRHVAAFDMSRKRMVMFGGRFRPAEQSSGLYTLYNDLWVFDVNEDRWYKVAQKGDIPSGRTNSAMVYDPFNDRMILFGGNASNDGLRFTPLDDTYTLDLETMTWTRVDSGLRPGARLFHTMTVDTKRQQVILFSGGDENAFFGSFYADVWALDLETLQWSLLWEGTGGGGLLPEPLGRISAGLIYDTEHDRVLLFGGHDDGALGNTNDLWAFDLDNRVWEVKREGDVYTGAGCPDFCSCAEDFVAYDYESPERRQYPTFIELYGHDQALLFSGTGDCGYMDDTWLLDLDALTWSEQQPAEQGIACARTGREDCTELCY